MGPPLLSRQVRTRRPIPWLSCSCLPGWGIPGQSPLVTPTLGVGLTRTAGGWRLEPRANWELGFEGRSEGCDGWDHIQATLELVTQVDKVLGMRCQLRAKGASGGNLYLPKGIKSQVKNVRFSAPTRGLRVPTELTRNTRADDFWRRGTSFPTERGKKLVLEAEQRKTLGTR